MGELNRSDEFAVIVPFDGGGSCPVQYETDYGGHNLYIRYRHSWLTIDLDDREILCQQLAPESANDGEWSDEETNVYLYLISEAIHNETLGSLTLPAKSEVAKHPFYRKGPLPRYHVRICRQAHHHTLDCYSKDTYSAKELEERKLHEGQD